MKQIPIALPDLGEDEWQAVREPIFSGWVTQGPEVFAFENEFSSRHQVEHALATTSCTSALHLILTAMGIGPGDEIIVPAFTWVATANVVQYCGAIPVFADVERETYNIDSEDVRRKITPKTKAIIVVHLFGLCANIDAIKSVAGEIPLVEDAACAVGADYRNQSAGSLGLAAAFSFHPRKPITTGEGGMITTRDPALAERMNALRNHGASISEEQRHMGSRPYILPEFNMLGYNYRMTDIQGAIGRVQLRRLDGFLKEREKWAAFYTKELAAVKWLRVPKIPDGCNSSWQAYVCYVDERIAPKPRNEIMEVLQTQGVSTRPGTHAVHMLGYYRERYNLSPDDCPVARDCDCQTIAIPIHNRMGAKDYEQVVQAIMEIA